MTLINLQTITEEKYLAILEALLYTGTEIEFANPTIEHESMALNLGLTTIMTEWKGVDVLMVRDEEEDINSWA